MRPDPAGAVELPGAADVAGAPAEERPELAAYRLRVRGRADPGERKPRAPGPREPDPATSVPAAREPWEGSGAGVLGGLVEFLLDA